MVARLEPFATTAAQLDEASLRSLHARSRGPAAALVVTERRANTQIASTEKCDREKQTISSQCEWRQIPFFLDDLPSS